MPYLLTKLEIHYGKIEQYSQIMETVAIPAFEQKGWTLKGAYTNRIGRLMRVYELWEVEDANSVVSAMNELMAADESGELAAKLGQIIFSEETELMETLPYHPD